MGLLRLRYARGRLRGPAGSARDTESTDAGHLLEAAGVAVDGPHAAGLLAALPAVPSPGAQIATLGRFEVTVDGEDVDVSRWQSRKARTLLKMLVARRGVPAHREELMEALWPDEDPARLANRLAVAITALRRGLDPQHTRPPGWLVSSKSGALSLNVENASIDLLSFASRAESGLRLASAGHQQVAQAVLEDAVNQHGGPFLPEDPYDDWAAPVREEARALLVRSLCTLGELAVQRGDHDAALGFAQRALGEHPGHPRALGLLARPLTTPP